MPEYYNLSKYSGTNNIMSVYSVTDELMKGNYSLFLVGVVFTFLFVYRKKKEDTAIDCLIYSGFYSLMVAMVLYAAQVFYSGITSPGLYLYVPAIILVTSSAIKWYNNR